MLLFISTVQCHLSGQSSFIFWCPNTVAQKPLCMHKTVQLHLFFFKPHLFSVRIDMCLSGCRQGCCARQPTPPLGWASTPSCLRRWRAVTAGRLASSWRSHCLTGAPDLFGSLSRLTVLVRPTGADRYDGRGHRSLRGHACGGCSYQDDGRWTVRWSDRRSFDWMGVGEFGFCFISHGVTLCLQPPSRPAEGL